MQQARLVLEDTDASREHFFEVAVSRMLHDRHVRRVSRWNHDAYVHTAFNRLPERLDRFVVGQEIGVLNANGFSRHANHEVMQDFHGRRRALGFQAGDVNVHASFGRELRKNVVTYEELAGVLDPVLAEDRLHGVHDGPAQSHAEIAHVVGALRVA